MRWAGGGGPPRPAALLSSAAAVVQEPGSPKRASGRLSLSLDKASSVPVENGARKSSEQQAKSMPACCTILHCQSPGSLRSAPAPMIGALCRVTPGTNLHACPSSLAFLISLCMPAVGGVTDVLTNGLPAPDPAITAAARPVVPGAAYQASYCAKRRLVPAAFLQTRCAGC